MAGYLDYLKQQQEMNAPIDYSQQMSKQQTYDPAQDFTTAYQPTSNATTQAMSTSPNSSSGGVDLAQAGTAAAAAAPTGPYGAAIAAVGSLASQYLAQKAMDERAKRDRYAAIQKGYGEDQQQAINQIMANNARALR